MVARAGNGSLLYLYKLERIERLEEENARLERDLAKANERIKDLESLQGEQLDQLAKENQELRLRLVPNGTETYAVLKAENVRLQNRTERLELVQRRLAKDLERAQS